MHPEAKGAGKVYLLRRESVPGYVTRSLLSLLVGRDGGPWVSLEDASPGVFINSGIAAVVVDVSGELCLDVELEHDGMCKQEGD